MATKTNKSEAEEPEEESESYLKYVMKNCTINITAEAGSQVILQSGNPTPPNNPPKG